MIQSVKFLLHKHKGLRSNAQQPTKKPGIKNKNKNKPGQSVPGEFILGKQRQEDSRGLPVSQPANQSLRGPISKIR